jgi:hypothetical protein
MPCKKCGLQCSSHCVDCVYVKTGLNLNDEEYHEILKLWNEQERVAENECNSPIL